MNPVSVLTRKVRKLRPIDIPLAEGETLPGGAICLTLPTLEALVRFWLRHRHRFLFAAEGVAWEDERYMLRPQQWVFAPTPAAVVATVLRWDQFRIQPRWKNWADSQPAQYELWCRERARARDVGRACGSWTADEEARFNAKGHDYRGYWDLERLPHGFTAEGLLETCSLITDPALTPAQVTTMLQARIFEAWHRSDACSELFYCFADDVDRAIELWGCWNEEDAEADAAEAALRVTAANRLRYGAPFLR